MGKGKRVRVHMEEGGRGREEREREEQGREGEIIIWEGGKRVRVREMRVHRSGG